MKKILTTTLALATFVATTWGQSIHGNLPAFTAPYTQPAQLGFTDFAGVYAFQRTEQVVSEVGFSTTYLSAQYPFFSSGGKVRYGTVALSFLRDASEVGSAPFRQHALEATYAYGLPLSPKHALAVALSGGYHLRRVGFENLATGSQWVPFQGVDTSLPNGETATEGSVGFATANASLGYQYRDEDQKPVVEVTVSAFMLNQPNEALLQFTPSAAPVRWAAAARVRAYQSGNLALYPELYSEYRRGNYLINGGIVMEVDVENTNPFDPLQNGKVRAAARYSQANVAVIAVQFDQPQYQIGFAYDIGLGSRSPRRYQSAFEVGLSLRLNRRAAPAKVVVTDYSLAQIRDFYSGEGVPADSESPKEKAAYTFSYEEDLRFGYKETKINQADYSALNQVRDLLMEQPQLRITIVGHTDPVRDRREARSVSLERAEAVKVYLQEQGIDPARMQVEGRGDAEPKYPNDTALNRARNRRIEFVISSED